MFDRELSENTFKYNTIPNRNHGRNLLVIVSNRKLLVESGIVRKPKY